MKFAIEQIGNNGGRIGRISGLRSQPEIVHKTPLFLVSTVGGSAPHLTQDTLHRVVGKEVPLCIPAQHFCDHVKTLQAFKKGVAHFAALKSHSTFVSVQDPSKTTPSGYNDKRGVSMWTYSGRQIISSESYMQLVEAMQPDWFESLNDADTDEESTKKRIKKSLALSSALLDNCLDIYKESKELRKTSLFAPLLGGHSEFDRTLWSKALVERLDTDQGIEGFSLLGIHTNGPTAENVEPKVAVSLAKSSLAPLPSELPRQCLGAWNPLIVLCLVQTGVDIFDTSFPFLVSERKGALIFPNSCNSEGYCRSDSTEHQKKKFKCDDTETTNSGVKKDVVEENDKKEMKGGKDNSPTTDVSVSSPYEICLMDESHFDAMKPILEGCECYTCKNFTRSYIHHLVNVKELLAPVLLMMHNLHHWNVFFTSIRKAIRDDTMDDLKKLLEPPGS